VAGKGLFVRATGASPSERRTGREGEGAGERLNSGRLSSHARFAYSLRSMGQLFCLASALCFGSMAIFGRFAADAGVDTPTLLLLRFSIAGAVMWGLLAARGHRLPRGRDLAVLVGMGAIGYAAQAWSYFSALEHASAGLVALLLYLHPVMVAVLARVVLKQPLAPIQLVAIAMALGGSALTVGNATDGTPLGVFLGIAAAGIYAVYILVGSRLSRAVTPTASTTVVVTSAAAVFAAGALARGVRLPATPAGWGAVLAIALVCTVAAVGLFLAGLERLGPVRASIYSTVEPAFTILLAVIVLGEALSAARLGGAALILGGVLLLARADLRRAAAAAAHDAEPAPEPALAAGEAMRRAARR
jgi:drug/metabolite transporter (DMT)-like permease